MATYYFGINVGSPYETVTQSATTTAKDVEVVINTTANVPTKLALSLAVEKLEEAITRSSKNWT